MIRVASPLVGDVMIHVASPLVGDVRNDMGNPCAFSSLGMTERA